MMRNFFGKTSLLKRRIDMHTKMRKTPSHVTSTCRKHSFFRISISWGRFFTFLSCSEFLFIWTILNRQCPNFYRNFVRIQKGVTFNQVKGNIKRDQTRKYQCNFCVFPKAFSVSLKVILLEKQHFRLFKLHPVLVHHFHSFLVKTRDKSHRVWFHVLVIR